MPHRKVASAEVSPQKPVTQLRKEKGWQEKTAATQLEPEDIKPVKAVAARVEEVKFRGAIVCPLFDT